MSLVVMVEERSMGTLLEGLIPRIMCPPMPPDSPGRGFRIIVHEGKKDLESSIPRKLATWAEPDAQFIIVMDQDRGDCLALKRKLQGLCPAHRSATIRIVCRELESWYLADLRAVDLAYGTHLARHQSKVKFRNPDHLVSPSQVLKRLCPGFQKVSGARAIAPHLDLTNGRSPSFAHLINSLRRWLTPTPGASSTPTI